MLIMPIIVLFFKNNGLTMRDILLLQSFFSIAIIIFEIPSGYFSDVIGRKITIILGSLISVLGFFIYSFSFSFLGFLVAELLLGLGASFISGTDSAMIYDTLLQINRENEYTKIEGRLTSIGNFAEGIASICGGFLALISLRTPFYVETFLLILVLPITFTLIEPKRHKQKNSNNPFQDILKIVKFSLHGNCEIKWLIIYSALVGSSTLTMVWFIQPFFEISKLPLALFGIAWAALQFSVGIFALYAHKFELIAGRKKSLISLIMLSTIGYFLVSYFQQLWAIGFIFIFYFVRGIHGPVLNDYINRLISSDIRATVLSVKNLAGRLFFSIIGPFIGWLNDLYSLSFAFMVAGTTFLILGSIALLFLNKHNAL